MKAPDDIKEALRKCIGWNSGYSCGECPYWNGSAMCKPELCNDAIACIDQLEKKTKWISVKDRMPEAYQPVIVHIRHTEKWRNTVLTEQPFHVVEEDVWLGDEWIRNVDGDILEVAHWMPMPEPPKEGLE